MREWCGSGSGSRRVVGSAIQPLNYACSKTISRTRACIVSFERFFFLSSLSLTRILLFVAFFFFFFGGLFPLMKVVCQSANSVLWVVVYDSILQLRRMSEFRLLCVLLWRFIYFLIQFYSLGLWIHTSIHFCYNFLSTQTWGF
jgi:hypothetical protein